VTPKRFSLWNSAGEIVQCKADALGFQNLHIISEASAFRKIIYIQILEKIIVILPLRCLKPFPLKFQRFSRNFPLFDFVTGDNTRTDLQLGLFPSDMSSKRSFTAL